MSKSISINGSLVDSSQAAISYHDSSYRVGLGVFSTLLVREGAILFLEDHLQRLRYSCERLWPDWDWLPPASDQLSSLVKTNLTADSFGRMRITVSASADGLMTVVTVDSYQPRSGLASLKSVTGRVHSKGALIGLKSTSYGAYSVALFEAQQRGGCEGLILNEHERVAEGATSNVFLVQGDVVLTPPPDEGLLPGIVRSKLLTLTSGAGVKVVERAIAASELSSADAVLLTSSLRGVQLVGDVDGNELNSADNPLAQQLVKLYEDEVTRYCANNFHG